MPDATSRPYAGQSADVRRRDRRARLTAAALDVLANGDWRAITVDKLCTAAGLNKRYFYESFSDLDAVAAAVVDDIAEQLRVVALQATASTVTEPLAVQAVAAVSALVNTLADDPRRAKVLLGAVALSPALQRHREDIMSGLTGVLVEYARTVHDVELERDPLAQVAPAFIIGGTADAILAFVEGRARVTKDELVQSIATLWLITGNGAAQVAQSRRES
ncbi:MULTISPECIES: TetR/AcrR family transcriptional regulator [Mycobacterium]|uniref:Transcriptional regulator n=1 Tax=Mycobacterium kiyosense TaxID=2871094 RepID=A0A9P3Q5K2_9MYCO|nr:MULTISPECIES: TetR/AcrR family transcriptional regulator [Mycobacterium]BDB40474.1 transcriptional regulator [Mycobacterium kiyosense]BDE12292.1 transcriptional regulator [Mycobacterium sp. 20KCMC460]GLB84123.1 transcriptional regulator [Mycobacterium kiyosense]GLB88530.1 transcriptional regulator [Mycobacterium kiyosense]GLB94841.1 transcriptional regulator [Mycobacterium kiyosense]